MKKSDHWENVAKFVPEWKAYNAEIDYVVDTDRLHRVGPLKYQRYLYALVRHFQPRVIVETGVRSGPSSVLAYSAMPNNGYMYSCDPIYASQEEAVNTVFRKTGRKLASGWTFFPGKSRDILDRLPETWDFFIHDSDHSASNMTFELTAARARLRPGGVIVCDDWNQKHGVFESFCAGIEKPFFEIGSAAFLVL